MCKLKSGIILKDRVYMPDHDHHQQMLEELGIKDTRENAETLFVRVELSPVNGDIFSSIDTWIFKVDQDIKPDWFVADYEKERFVNEVKQWAKNSIFVGIDNLNVKVAGNITRAIYLKDCRDANITSCGTSTANIKSFDTSTANIKSFDTSTANVESFGTSTANVESCGTSTANIESFGTSTANITSFDTSTANVESCGTSTANIESFDTSTANIKSFDTSTANIKSFDTSTANIKSFGTSTANVESCGTSTANKLWASLSSKFVTAVCDNSTLKDHTAKIIYQSGDWRLVSVDNREVKG